MRPEWTSIFTDVNLLDWIKNNSTHIVRDRPSVQLHLCNSAQGNVYCKVITAANDAPPGKRRIGRTLKWTLRRSRAIAAMRVSARMNAASVPCAPIVLAARKRSGLHATDIIISPEVVGSNMRTLLRATPHADQRLSLTEKSAHAVVHLHARGFMHGDLHPNNIMVLGPDSDLCFIDNDRTREWHMPLPWIFREKNLFHMCFALHRESADLPGVFLDAYLAQINRLHQRRRESIQQRVMNRVHKELARREAKKTRLHT